MSTLKLEETDKSTNSYISMLAADSFNNILKHVQNSSLNYYLQSSPFSALISIKKYFMKYINGEPIIPIASEVKICSPDKDISRDDNIQFKTLDEFDL